MPTTRRPYFDPATRAQVIALKVYGATNQEITQQTGIQARAANYIYDRAIQRGFDPKAEHPIIQSVHVENAPRGRPSKQTDEIKETILNKVYHYY